jgi:hypothetical protein
MNNLNLDKYLNITNEEKNKRGLETYIPLYPMLRVEDNKLYVCVVITKEEDNVWDISGNVTPEYWVLIDIKTDKIVAFNKTSENEIIIDNKIEKNIESKEKELSKYTIEKTLEYKNYLINDIKNEKLPLQKRLSAILEDEMEVNGESININDYLLANLEEDIKTKIDELVQVLIYSKYGSITFYYDSLFKQITEEYKETNKIDIEKIKYCIEIMNNYYDGVIAAENIFNIKE